MTQEQMEPAEHLLLRDASSSEGVDGRDESTGGMVVFVKLLLFNTLQSSRWTVATKNGGVSMMHFASHCL